MIHSVLRVTAFLLLACLVAPVRGEKKLTLVQIGRMGKAATALVECDLRGGKAHGSAFCIHSSGLFVTNEHVVAGNTAIRLVLDPSLKTQKIVKAKVIRIDRENGLALLRAEGVEDLPALALGDSGGLEELTEVVAFGFPFGKSLTVSKDDYPAVSVNKGAVTALRRKGDELHRIQVDVALESGNSGGAVLDLKGKVVGVVVSGVRGAGANFVIPVSHLERALGRPELSFTAPKVAIADRGKPATFEAKAVTLIPGGKPPTLELVLTVGGKTRRVAMRGDAAVYRATAIPLPPGEGPAVLRVTLDYPDGTVTGNVSDRAVEIEGKGRQLSEIKAIRGGPKPRIEFHDGKAIEAMPPGLKEIELSLGGEKVKLKTATLLTASLAPADDGSSVKCVVVVKSGDKVIAEASDVISFRPPTKDEGGRWTASVEMTDKAGKWLTKEAKVGTRMFTDRTEYVLSIVPKEMVGGTLVVRGSGEQARWLPDLALEAKKKGTVYAILRVKYAGQEKFGELAEAQLKKDGWKEVEGKVATTQPEGEKWEWKAFETSIEKGVILLRLDHLEWSKNATGVLFVVK